MSARLDLARHGEALEGRLERELAILRKRANALVAENGAGKIHRPFFADAGKLLRPRLLFLSLFYGEDVGYEVDISFARDAALAIELCHVGSLYHDDVADRSPIRRGVPAVHETYDARVASLAGGHLVSLGNMLAATFPTPLARAWGEAGLRMTEGQLRDIERTGVLRGSIEDFIRVCWKKTGAAFELAAQLGASAANVPRLQAEALKRYGRHLGIAFQLFDDLNDFARQPGKHRPPANDLRERVYTLPVLYGAAQRSAVGMRIRHLLRNDGRPLSSAAVEEVCELLTEGGGFRAAVDRTVNEQKTAARWLARLNPTPSRDALSNLLGMLKPPAALTHMGSGV